MIKENEKYKIISSKNFNLFFIKKTGFTMTWGKTKEDDPNFCPQGPIIADIEISEICNQGCSFCYKSNNSKGSNMSFDAFKTIFHKLPRSLTQIAFGIGDVYTNPDLKKIMTYCRKNIYQYIIPNITINGSHMTNEWYDYFAKTCGATAVSNYDEDNCFNTIKELTDRGMKQVNIHQVLYEENVNHCLDLIKKVKTDKRLSKLNAVVFLMLKQKGRGTKYNRISNENYKYFITKLFKSKINFGFDSCGSARLLNYGVPDYIKQYITPCESTRESLYINVHGKFYPCSFNENGEGLDIINCKNFITDIWMHKNTVKWRNMLLKNNCNCPTYKI